MYSGEYIESMALVDNTVDSDDSRSEIYRVSTE